MLRRTLLAAAAFGLLAAPAAFAQTNEIRFGLIPSEDADKLIADSQPFIKAFEAAVGMKVKPFVALDYSAVVEALKSDKLEVAFLGPAAYILAKDKVKVGVDPVARGVMAQTGKSSYRALIIAHPDQPIRSLADLKGKTFALVDPASTSGNFVPRLALHKNGINPEKDFKSLYYSGTHQASLIAVKEGKVNAAGIADEVYDLAISRGQLKKEDVRIVFESDPIPGSPFVVRTNLPKDLQDKLRKGLLAISNVQFGKLGVVNAMDPATDKDYDTVRELIAFQDQQKKAAGK
ncbi:MAG: phosphate/phosphite/phosphonate ABC transporter substrate-binding protein [Alphaproteobacteria bacterium]|nr:phosphate/phosphite/phosphonate ABC transporter substrate-binding protein [Alphaproteobacteria bacterium]MBM3950060.1 phosphate/phosphite/phosphonate ABC transporter substrate-binding protein [Rhodospirillales bacterium]